MEYDLIEHEETSLAGPNPEDRAVLTNETLFRQYKGGGRGKWQQQATEDVEFVNGAMWKTEDVQELQARGQFVPNINETKAGIEQLIAQLTANKPRFNSTGRENSDTNTAKNFADLGAYIWDISNGNQKLKRAVRDYEYVGIGALMAYVDSYADNGKGEIYVTDIDPFDLFIDPNSKEPNAQDAAHILIAKTFSGEQIKAIYPMIDLKKCLETKELNFISGGRFQGEDQLYTGLDNTHKHYLAIDRYSKVKVEYYHVLDPHSNFEKLFDEKGFSEFVQLPAIILQRQGAEPKVITKESEVREYLQIHAQSPTIHYALDQMGQPQLMPGAEDGDPYAIQNSTTLIQPVTMGQLIDMKAIELDKPLLTRIQRVLTVGNQLVFDKVLPIENYPIVTFMLHHNRSPYPYGDVRVVRPLNEQLNKIESLIVSHAANSTNVKVIVGKDTVDKQKFIDEFGRAGAAVLEVDLELGQPIIVQPIPLPNELYKNRDDKAQQIQRILGAFAFQDGDVSNAPQTYRGTLTMDEMGQRRSRSKRDDIEAAIDQLFKSIVEMIPYVYTERKVIRLLSPNHEIRETTFNDMQTNEDGSISEIINDVTVGKYDVVVVSGSMLPSNRYARVEMFLEFYKMGVLTDNTVILRESDIPDVEKVIERQDKMMQLGQALEQAQQKIKELEGDLQTANRETVQANQKVEVMKFKAGVLDPAKSEIKSATKLSIARLNDHVKNSKVSDKQQ